MSKKAKLSQLNKELSGSIAKPGKNKPVAKSTGVKKANPIRGERGAFQKVTITLDPQMIADLKIHGVKRKLEGLKDNDVSSLIRLAVTNFLKENS